MRIGADNAQTRATYQDFLNLWKDAAPDPILKEAKDSTRSCRRIGKSPTSHAFSRSGALRQEAIEGVQATCTARPLRYFCSTTIDESPSHHCAAPATRSMRTTTLCGPGSTVIRD